MNTIRKITGPFGHERMTIRSFKYSDDMHKFLNRGTNALTWKQGTDDLKSGTYAYVGGEWVNVQKLDRITLAHV